MDLFKSEYPKEGFSADVAKKVVEMFKNHFRHEQTMYPFNHILTAARFGYTHITKPRQGLAPSKANMLKQLGYDVTFDLEKEEWTISWE